MRNKRHDDNVSSTYKISIENKFLRIAIIVVIAILIGVCCFFVFFPEGISTSELVKAGLKQFLGTIIGALIAFVCFGIFKQKETEKKRDEYVTQQIWKTMQAEDNELISDFYKESAIDSVVKNCLKNYCMELSDSYFSYIKSHLKVFRTEFTYNVEINKSNKETDADGNNLYTTIQEISYRRYFKASESQHQFYCNVRFSYSQKDLEAALHKNHYFFREVVLDKNVVDELIACGNDKEAIIQMLGFKLFITDMLQPVPHDKIKIESDKYGITFQFQLSSDDIKFDNTMADLESHADCYASYKAKVECCFDMHNYFYAIFAEPCIKPYFQIKFDKSIPLSTVHYVSCISAPVFGEDTSSDKLLIAKESRNMVEFKVPRGYTIFPTSGIYFNW